MRSALGPGDVVWTVPNTFVASANCARLCGADVDFVDIDPRTYNISVPALAQKLREAKARRPPAQGRHPGAFQRPRAATRTRSGRSPSDYGFRVIEDASHASARRHGGEPVGSCRWSDIAVFSFHPVKIVTTAEGGLRHHARAGAGRADGAVAHARHHQATSTLLANKAEGGWYYEQIELGFNYRLTDMQAALGLSQLRRLEQFLRRRRELVARYDRLLADLPVTRPLADLIDESAWHLYVIRIDPKRAGKTRRQVYDAMRAARHRRAGALHPGPSAALLPRAGLQARPLPGGRALFRRSAEPAALSGADGAGSRSGGGGAASRNGASGSGNMDQQTSDYRLVLQPEGF